MLNKFLQTLKKGRLFNVGKRLIQVKKILHFL